MAGFFLQSSRNYIYSKWSSYVFEYLERLYFASNRLSSLPELEWAPNARVLDLSSNMISLNSSNRFWQNFTNLQVLHLNNNPLRKLHAGSFLHLTGLRVLNMANCLITHSQKDAFKGFIRNDNNISVVSKGTFPPSLNMLNLSENMFVEFESDFLVHPLDRLLVSYNQVSKFDPGLLHMVNTLDLSWNKLTNLFNWKTLPDNMVELILSGNPWSCDCFDGPRLQQFILNHSDIIVDMQDMQCYQDEVLYGHMIVSGKYVATIHFMPCPDAPAIDDAGGIGLPSISSFLISFLSLLIVLFVLALCFREWISLKWYIITGCRCGCSKIPPNAYEYDIFINYSRNDHDINIMKHDLVPMLEKYYTICIPDRDWPVGDDHFAVIDESIRSSRNVILLISDSFCRDAFCMFTFSQIVAAEKLERSSRLILVLLEDVVQGEDEELKQYLKSKKCISLTDEKLKKKLLYLLPRSSVRSRHSQGTELVQMNRSDVTISLE